MGSGSCSSISRGVGKQAAAAALVAGAIAALFAWLGPPGRDLAAHAYQLNVFVDHGFALWDNFWYAGRYSFVTYSLVYYPLAAVFGIPLLAVVSVAGSAFGFALVAGREWGDDARLPTLAFALVWPSIVFSAAFPFALGVASGLLALGGAAARAAALVRGARRPHARCEPTGVPAARRRARGSGRGTAVAAPPQPAADGRARGDRAWGARPAPALPEQLALPVPRGRVRRALPLLRLRRCADGRRPERADPARALPRLPASPLPSSSSCRRGSARTSRAFGSQRSR